MKKIGIIDYFIDEFHSNEYLGLFEKANKELGLDYQIMYAYADVNKEGRLTTDEWCQKNHVTRCFSIEELCEKSDKLLILAPANPETHLEYAKKALRYGKDAYIDKTFAPDLETAKAIFSVAAENGVKIFSSSALRYTKELEEMNGADSLIVTGGGRSLEEYIIHQIEMAVKLLGTNARSVQVHHHKNQTSIAVDFSGKTAVLNYSNSSCGFSVDAGFGDKASCLYRKCEDQEYFYGLAKSILTFYESEKIPFDNRETLCVIAIRDAILKGTISVPGERIAVQPF